jgi:hypothetical protein
MIPLLHFDASDAPEGDWFSCGTISGDWALCPAGCRLGEAPLPLPALCINSIRNAVPGNGHFEAFLQQLYRYCEANNYAAVFLNVLHPFYAQLIRRGFRPLPGSSHLMR